MFRIPRRLQTGLGLTLLLWGMVRATEADPPSEGPARLIHDFFPGEFVADQPPSQLTKLGDVLYFVASDIDHGQRVWRSDGTPAGTRLVSFPGEPAFAESSTILGRVGSHVLWVTFEKDSQRGWLVSSGRRGDGVVLEPPVSTSKALLGQSRIVGEHYFFYRCGSESCSIWSTDGTLPGMGPVRALARFTTRDQQIVGTFAGRWLLFRVAQSLYAYDVTRDRALQILPAEARELRDSYYPTGDSLFLLTGRGPARLWVSRLDAPQAKEIFKARDFSISGWHGGKLYFNTQNGRLWSADGKSGKVRPYSNLRVEPYAVLADELGTLGPITLLSMPGYYWGALLAANEEKHELREIHRVCSGKYECLGASMSSAVVAGDLAFLEIGHALWQTDGTRDGTKTHDVLDRTDPRTFRVIGDRLVLGATSREGEKQLWETDGTASGTRALSDGDLDRPFQVQGPPMPLAGALYVAADQKPVGQQLWRVAEGRATPVTGLRHMAVGISPYFAIPLGKRVVIDGLESWLSLGADGSVEELPAHGDPCGFAVDPCSIENVVLGSRLLYAQEYLHATDGTAEGTVALPPSVAALGRWGDRALILDRERNLWVSDGSVEGTHSFARLPNSRQEPIGPPYAMGPLAFLFRKVRVDRKLEALELWRTDGTAAGTLRLAAIPFEGGGWPTPRPTLVGGRLFFRFLGTLWVSDGSIEGTRSLPGLLPDYMFSVAASGATLYAVTENFDVDDRLQTLWAIDPATLKTNRIGTFRQIAQTIGDPFGSALGEALFFSTTDEEGDPHWWVTEGTPESTHPLPEPLASNIPWMEEFFNAGDRRWFTACDSEHGCELWSTDRLGEDSQLVQDLWPGPENSFPEILAVTDDALWFAATEPDVGRELWKIDLSEIDGSH